MLSANIKIQTHIQGIRENLITNPKSKRKFVLYGLFAFIYCLLNVYLGLRGWQAFSTQLNLPVYLILLTGLMLVMPVAAFLLDQGREVKAFPKFIAYTGFYWTAFFMYSVILMISVDIFQTLNRFSNDTLFSILPDGFKISRQEGVWLVIAASLILLGVGTWLARRPRLTHYQLQVAKVMPNAKPLKIALLSDIHYGSMVSTANLKTLCRTVMAQRPDLILLAGDLIDNSLDLIRETDFVRHMSGLQAPLGVFAVLGNHELVNADVQETVDFFASAGIRVLLDETVNIDDQLVLVGRNESRTAFSGPLDQMAPQMFMAGLDNSKPVIVMQHQPAELALLADAGADLAVAGHTHAGQLFPLNLLHRRHFEQTGPYRSIDGLHSIISDGYGTWGPPIRVGSRSEIVIIGLTGESA